MKYLLILSVFSFNLVAVPIIISGQDTACDLAITSCKALVDVQERQIIDVQHYNRVLTEQAAEVEKSNEDKTILYVALGFVVGIVLGTIVK